MKNRKPGQRHYLLFYQRMMSRLFGSTLALGLVILACWFWGSIYEGFLIPPFDWLVLMGAIFTLLFALFALLAQKMSYVQPRPDHLSIVTPFLRLKISYRRIKSVHSANLQQLFPPQKARWSDKRFLEPFYGMTVVIVELNDYPLSPAFLRLFLPRQSFLPKTPGFVLVTKDWMTLSTDIDTFIGNWKQAQARRRSAEGGGAIYR